MTMMGKAAYTLLVAFIASVLTLLAVNWLAPEDESRSLRPSTPATAVAGTTPAAGTTAAAGTTTPVASTAPAVANDITLQQVSTHNSAASCWIIVNGIVYDITSYIPKHPTDESVLLAWCGKESTQAWEDKGGIGKSHSSRAEAALDTYEIGRLNQ